MPTVAIVGAGGVGRALGERVMQAGAALRFGVRDPSADAARPDDALAEVPVRAVAEAAADASIIMLAVPAMAAIEACRAAGALAGKIVVDCTNPIRWDGGPVWSPPREGSVAAAIAATFPEARVVKGFNHFGVEVQRQPTFATGPADALFAGDDTAAKLTVMELATGMGFRPRDAGPLRNAALLENLAVLWIQLSSDASLGRDFAFRLEHHP